MTVIAQYGAPLVLIAVGVHLLAATGKTCPVPSRPDYRRAVLTGAGLLAFAAAAVVYGLLGSAA